MVNIAIDGPAGAGKSTIAKLVAKELGYIYVDTGALYRAIGLYMINNGINLDDTGKISENAQGVDIRLAFEDGKQKVLLSGEDVSDKIRTPQVSMAASAVSAVPKVREFLISLQRKIAENNNVIMDGRDISTVILPDAQVKIFLTASDKVRAKRRFCELEENGENVTFEEVLEDIQKRDFNDSTREAAPLKMSEDAILVDTSDLSLKQSIKVVIEVIKERV